MVKLEKTKIYNLYLQGTYIGEFMGLELNLYIKEIQAHQVLSNIINISLEKENLYIGQWRAEDEKD
jgi:hypothetical protein